MKRDLQKKPTQRPMDRFERHIINASKRDLHVLKETYQNRPNDRPVRKAYHQWRKKSPTYMKRGLQKTPTHRPMDKFERYIINANNIHSFLLQKSPIKETISFAKETCVFVLAYQNRLTDRPMVEFER